MSSKDQHIQDVLVVIQKGIKKHGSQKIIRSIQVIDLQANNVFYHEIFNYILEIVVKEFKIERKDLYGRKKRGVVTTARKIAILIAKTHLEISDEQLAIQFDRTRQMVYDIRLEFVRMENVTTAEKHFTSKYDKLNSKVVGHINKLKGE